MDQRFRREDIVHHRRCLFAAAAGLLVAAVAAPSFAAVVAGTFEAAGRHDAVSAGAVDAQAALLKALDEQTKLLGEPSALGADGSPSDRFGSAVAVAGDTLVVGAPDDWPGNRREQGSAYVFVRVAGAWVLQAKLLAADGVASDRFGASVAVAGDTVVVGAPLADTDGTPGAFGGAEGAVYVFTRSGTAWSQQAKLLAADRTSGARLGWSVAIDADTVVAGIQPEGASAIGAAYVFTRSGATWSQQAKLQAIDGAGGDRFGGAVALDGDTAVVGAFRADVGAAVDQGAAYVFVRGGTVWTQQQKLLAADGAAGDWFGSSVAVAGQTALVGAYADDVGANANQGAAYAFVRSGTLWSQQAKLVDPDGAAGALFGISVGLAADTALVGAPGDDPAGVADRGSARVFTRGGAIWTAGERLLATDGAFGDLFGWAVAFDGDTALVGVPDDDLPGNANQGSAHAFSRDGATWSAQGPLNAGQGATDDQFGRAIAVSGDTALIAAPWDDVGANVDQGSVFVFVRSGGQWLLQAKLLASDGATSDRFGDSVAIDGDTALVGASIEGSEQGLLKGAAYVFTRSGSTWTQQAKLEAADLGQSLRFGRSVAISGDVALVGAPGYFAEPSGGGGAAYVFVRTGGAWTQQARLRGDDGPFARNFGWSVAIDGETAVVGDWLANTAMANDGGSAFVFVRDGTTWTQQSRLVAAPPSVTEGFGASVAIDGDAIAVGAPNENVGTNEDQGAAYVFVRTGPTWVQQARVLAPNGAAFDRFGTSVALASNRVLAGAVAEDVGPVGNAGAAHLFSRADASWVHESRLVAVDGAGSDGFGTAVALAPWGALVGSPFAAGPPPYGNRAEGAAYAFSDGLFSDGFESPALPASASGRTP